MCKLNFKNIYFHLPFVREWRWCAELDLWLDSSGAAPAGKIKQNLFIFFILNNLCKKNT